MSKYLSAVAGALPPADAFNASGIAYADIVTLGDNMLVYWFGELYPLGGTSSSGPAAAGLLALLNDARLNAGMAPVGYVNNVFYALQQQAPDAFTDVVVGGNNDGDIQPPGSPFPTYCSNGFPAAQGWCVSVCVCVFQLSFAKLTADLSSFSRDPASGLGSPNMRVITDHFLGKN